MSLDKVTFCNSDDYNEEYGIRYHCHLTGYAYYIIDDVKWLIDSRTMEPSTKYEDMKRRWIEIFEKNHLSHFVFEIGLGEVQIY